MVLNTNRFPKKYRLTSPEEYRRVFNSNIRSADSRFIVLARKNGLEYSRLGFVISKKKIPLATSRNLIKRTVRESFRQGDISRESLDLVVMPQKAIDTKDRKILRNSLDAHWRRLSK